MSPTTTGEPTRWRPPALGGRLAGMLAPLVAAAVLGLDQVTKAWAVRELAAEPRSFGDLVVLRLVANHGTILGPAPRSVLLLAGIGVVVATLWPRPGQAARLAAASGAIAGGAAGNTLDRLVERTGFPDGAVVDWIATSATPVFNLADAALVLGALLLVIGNRNEDRPAGGRVDQADATGEGPARSGAAPADASSPSRTTSSAISDGNASRHGTT